MDNCWFPVNFNSFIQISMHEPRFFCPFKNERLQIFLFIEGLLENSHSQFDRKRKYK